MKETFESWSLRNDHIVKRFFAEADRVWNAGRRHYSARTIIHYLRHESEVRENGGEFKVNNDVSPGLARLYMRATGRPIFETRVQKKRGFLTSVEAQMDLPLEDEA